MVGGEEDEYSLDGDKVCRSVIKNNNSINNSVLRVQIRKNLPDPNPTFGLYRMSLRLMSLKNRFTAHRGLGFYYCGEAPGGDSNPGRAI